MAQHNGRRRSAHSHVAQRVADGRMPLLAILLSVLGLVPFIVCGLAALGPDPTTADRMLSALIGYAAVTLAFAGGIHWGFELQSRQPDRFVERARLGLGIVAAAGRLDRAAAAAGGRASWVSLIVLIAAYIGAVLVEQEAARRDLLPPRYLWLRWGFTRGRRRDDGHRADAPAARPDDSILRFVWI